MTSQQESLRVLTYHFDSWPMLTSCMIAKINPRPPPSCSSSIKSAVALFLVDSTADLGISQSVAPSEMSQDALTANAPSSSLPPQSVTVEALQTKPAPCIHDCRPSSLLLIDMVLARAFVCHENEIKASIVKSMRNCAFWHACKQVVAERR